MIKLVHEGPIAAIELDRAATRNALDEQGWRGLSAALAALPGTPARALIIRSRVEGTFSSGADLSDLENLSLEPSARAGFRAMMRDAIDALPHLPIPTIAAIDGDCFGAGVALALGCDIRLAGERARFAVTPARLGISYPQEDVERLVAAVGQGQAARLLFTAEPIGAAEAARIGLVEQACVSAEARALEMAEAIAANSGHSLKLLKAMVRGLTGKAESDDSFDACFGGEAFADRLAAFRRRRNVRSTPVAPLPDRHSPDPSRQPRKAP